MRIRNEIAGGLTTFFTMAYIVVVNPAILSTKGTGMSFSGVLTATVLVCFALTLMMGLYARLPFAVAPGMGINAFFTYSIVLGRHVPWQTALGTVFWAGVLFVGLSVTPVRERIAKAVPPDLRAASAAGIGIFLTFIGLRNIGFIAADAETLVHPGPFTAVVAIAVLGGAVSVWLMGRNNPLAFLAGIFSATLAAWGAGLVHAPEHLVSMPDFSSVFMKVDPFGALKLSMLPSILSILFTDLFDSISTFIGVAVATDMLDDKGEPKNLREGLIVDAFATLGASLAGTSSGTAYIESAAGIEAGGRTGLSAVVTAFCFLPCLFIAPLAGMVPACATAPVLILVGALMFKSVARLPLKRLEDAVPAFLTTILIPLTFSITQGLLWGFITHAAMYALAGRAKEVKPTTWALAAVSVGLLAVENLA
jgi:AGZA family xanthine/uracil permease-like MFS transporter